MVNDSRIIIPFGRPIKRIQIDIDAKGQVQINGYKSGATATAQGVAVPMSALEVTTLLAGVVASNLLAISGAVPFQANPAPNGGGDGDKTTT